jgi:hypothetical protein
MACLYIAEKCSYDTCIIKTRWDIVANKGGLIFSFDIQAQQDALTQGKDNFELLKMSSDVSVLQDVKLLKTKLNSMV